MSIENKSSRELFEKFHCDTRFENIRKLRSELQPNMKNLQDYVTGIMQGKTALKVEYIPNLSNYVLQMLQLEHAMIEACEIMPVEFEPVKVRILADFDTKQSKAYLQQVKSWLQLIDVSE